MTEGEDLPIAKPICRILDLNKNRTFFKTKFTWNNILFEYLKDLQFQLMNNVAKNLHSFRQ